MGVLDAPPIDYRGKPSALFDPSRDMLSLIGWFDAWTLPGANGSAVTLWPASAGGFALKVTPTAKPTLLTNAAAGKNAVRFVPTSYILKSDTIGAGGLGLVAGWPQPITYAFVFRLSADYANAANGTLLGSTNCAVNIVTGLGLYGRAPSNPVAYPSAPLNDGQWHVGIVCLGTAGSVIYVDGYLTSASATNLGTGTVTGFYIGPGANMTPNTAGTSDVAEAIVANSVLTPTRIDAITQALAKKWGIS